MKLNISANKLKSLKNYKLNIAFPHWISIQLDSSSNFTYLEEVQFEDPRQNYEKLIIDFSKLSGEANTEIKRSYVLKLSVAKKQRQNIGHKDKIHVTLENSSYFQKLYDHNTNFLYIKNKD